MHPPRSVVSPTNPCPVAPGRCVHTGEAAALLALPVALAGDKPKADIVDLAVAAGSFKTLAAARWRPQA
ncbi:MAG: hypothetical protein R3E65_07195 [Steroidobacteraceae bacterium]